MARDQRSESEGREQFAFALRPPADMTEARFVRARSNADARAWLAQEEWPDRRLWLWGPEGCGKTHLLHVWASRRGARVMDARLLDSVTMEPKAVPGALALDNVGAVGDERALLHLLNMARDSRAHVLMAGVAPPSRLDVALPDLASRLRATVAVAVGKPEDTLRATVLLRLLAERQLVVGQHVTDWLCRRLPRTGSALLEAVERLDAEALARRRPVTRTMARHVLADLLKPDETQATPDESRHDAR